MEATPSIDEIDTVPTAQTDPVQAARQLSHDAERLAHAVDNIPRPFTSYAIIANVAAANTSLRKSLENLASWHARAEDGTHYEDVGGLGVEGAQQATARLDEAARLANQLQNVLHDALHESGKVRWLDTSYRTSSSK